jgi:hypothetical protein
MSNYERLTVRNGIDEGELIKCMECSPGPNNDRCGLCEELPKAFDRLAEYEDTGISPEDLKEIQVALQGKVPEWLERNPNLATNRLAERFVVLPCKPRDSVYELSPRRDKVYETIVPNLHTIARWMEDGVFGTEIFVTKEEAEAVLNESGGEANV